MNEVGKRLRLARKQTGMSQVDLGEKAGLSDAAVSRWENGEVTDPERTLAAFAQALGVRLEWLKTGLGEMKLASDPNTGDPVLDAIIRTYRGLSEQGKAGVREYVTRLTAEWAQKSACTAVDTAIADAENATDPGDGTASG